MYVKNSIFFCNKDVRRGKSNEIFFLLYFEMISSSFTKSLKIHPRKKMKSDTFVLRKLDAEEK